MADIVLPTRGQVDWDDEVNTALQIVQANALAAQSTADNALGTALSVSSVATTKATEASTSAANAAVSASSASSSASLAQAAAAAAASVGSVVSTSAADGTTDDRSAIAAADTSAASAGALVQLKKGTHRVATSLTITSPVIFQPGAILKPDSGATVTLSGGVQAGLSQIIDQSAGGIVVPNNVDAWHPAWWGPVRTADDTTTWTRMMAARTASGVRQTIRVPQDVGSACTRLWNLTVDNVHIDASGHSRTIKPALASAVSGGYVIQQGTQTTINGGEWSTDSVAGVKCIYYTGGRSWINNAYIRPLGAGSIGVHAYAATGSITPRMSNCIVYSGDGGGSAGPGGIIGGGTGTGLGVKIESADAELTSVWIGFVDTGIETAASTTLTDCHIWGCKSDGVSKLGDNAVLNGCYIESNGGYGVRAAGAEGTRITATRFWRNGWDNSGGSYLGAIKYDGTGVFCENNIIRGTIFDDNYGTGITTAGLVAALDVDAHFLSATAQGGGTPNTTDLVSVSATASKIDLRLKTSPTKPYTGSVLVNAAAGHQVNLDLGAFTARMTADVTYTSNATLASISGLSGVPVKAGEVYRVRGVLFVNGGQPGDMLFKVRGTNSGDLTGFLAITAPPATATTSTSAASVNPSNAVAVTATGGSGLQIGLLGTTVPQAVPFEAVLTVVANTNVNFQASQAVSDATASTISAGSYARFERIA